MALSTKSCPHDELQIEVSPHAEEAGFDRVSLARRNAAATPSGRVVKGVDSQAHEDCPSTFPGPLILPDDDLALNPAYPAQSLRSWMQLREWNAVTEDRKTVYVASPPQTADEAAFVGDWTVPRGHESDSAMAVGAPKTEDLCKYLEAFYHGLPVKRLPHELFFAAWESPKPGSKELPNEVGLCAGATCTHIRTRPCPDKAFDRQLNINDIIDAELLVLPADAYAVVLMVHHDLYEDEEDEFCCGRAYGASRVAVVSTARYHPVLDAAAGIDRTHMWPASHCKAYVEGMCLPAEQMSRKRRKTRSKPEKQDNNPLPAALEAARAAAPPQADLYGLWMSRIVRTAAHELGHCFGMDHCVYYACVMQGTASIIEDVRQPPYLCPVCLQKLTRATLETRADDDGDRDGTAYILARYTVLAEVCAAWSGTGMFAGFGAWLKGRMAELRN